MEAQKTWKPTVGGFLEIVIGGLSLLVALCSALFPPLAHAPDGFYLLAVPFLIFGVLELLGGIYAFKRQKWVLALIGSVCAFLAFFPVGIPAVIFTILSKGEFES
ncbi:MAG TPA: hypothetical protein G4O09_06145 [Dehalococcoidia bacterium]|nr:hypothetical protein [Dehalococcoidia bacterium]